MDKVLAGWVLAGWVLADWGLAGWVKAARVAAVSGRIKIRNSLAGGQNTL